MTAKRRPTPEPDVVQWVDLCTLLPENFNEIPYIGNVKGAINVKRTSLEQFNQELDNLVQ